MQLHGLHARQDPGSGRDPCSLSLPFFFFCVVCVCFASELNATVYGLCSYGGMDSTVQYTLFYKFLKCTRSELENSDSDSESVFDFAFEVEEKNFFLL